MLFKNVVFCIKYNIQDKNQKNSNAETRKFDWENEKKVSFYSDEQF